MTKCTPTNYRSTTLSKIMPPPTVDNISIVFQGAIDRQIAESSNRELTEYCLARTREVFPKAELILSTWSEQRELSRWVDRVIINKDPGAIIETTGGKNFLTNINRQIESSRGGLRSATREYALKLRTDCYLTKSDFLGFYKENCEIIRGHTFLRQKILISALGCVNLTSWPAPYHISDLFQFGLTADMLSFWDANYCPKAYANWHATSKIPMWRRGGGFGERPEKIAPEQYLFMDFLDRNGLRPSLDSILTLNFREYWKSEKYFATYFLPCPSSITGVVLPKRLRIYDHSKHYSYRYDYKLVAHISNYPILLRLWLIARAPLYMLSCLWWWFKCLLRPYVGSQNREVWHRKYKQLGRYLQHRLGS